MQKLAAARSPSKARRLFARVLLAYPRKFTFVNHQRKLSLNNLTAEPEIFQRSPARRDSIPHQVSDADLDLRPRRRPVEVAPGPHSAGVNQLVDHLTRHAQEDRRPTW